MGCRKLTVLPPTHLSRCRDLRLSLKPSIHEISGPQLVCGPIMPIWDRLIAWHVTCHFKIRALRFVARVRVSGSAIERGSQETAGA